MIRRRFLVIIAILLLLNAALEATPKDVVISIGMNPLSASPRNPTPYGTSALAEELAKAGYRVAVVASPGDIPYVVRNDTRHLVVVIIAPDTLEPGETQLLSSYASDPSYSFLLAGENTNGIIGMLARNITHRACQLEIAPASPESAGYNESYLATSRDTLLARVPGGEPMLLTTGYVAPIVVYGRWAQGEQASTSGHVYVVSNNGSGLPRGTLVLTDPQLLGMTLSESGSAWSPIAVSLALEEAMATSGYPVVGVVCQTPGGSSVAVIGDSTIFTNMALKEGIYRNFSTNLIGYLARGADPSHTVVVFLTDIYRGNLSVSLRFHPSILLNIGIRYYKNLENFVREKLGSRIFTMLVMIGALLSVFTLAPKHVSGMQGSKLERPLRHPAPPAVLGVEERLGKRRRRVRDALELCAFADGMLRESIGIGLEDLRVNPRLLKTMPSEDIARYAEELSALCERLSTGSVLLRITDILGLTAKDVEAVAQIVERLQGRLARVELGE